jgi:hypothetical protein
MLVDAAFMFNFYNDEIDDLLDEDDPLKGAGVNYGFMIYIDTMAVPNFFKLAMTGESDSDPYTIMLDDLESEYGVHDFSCSGSETIGYTSYEVEVDKQLELMNKWRQFFLDNGVLRCSEVRTYTDAERDDNAQNNPMHKELTKFVHGEYIANADGTWYLA